jgi:hypothetical protein
MATVVPSPGRDDAEAVPPWASATACTNESPGPVPRVLRLDSALMNRSKALRRTRGKDAASSLRLSWTRPSLWVVLIDRRPPTAD